jgi:hypothetical protein
MRQARYSGPENAITVGASSTSYPNETIIEKLFPATDAIAQGAEALQRRKSAAFHSFSF